MVNEGTSTDVPAVIVTETVAAPESTPGLAEKQQEKPPDGKNYTTTYIVPESMEPDVTIVVGGIEFREFSQSLCCWSSYFDAAFNSGMKETKTKTFEFPDRDPEEWQWLVSLMAPLATEKIDRSNVFTALSWFDLLHVPRGLASCDELLANTFPRDKHKHYAAWWCSQLNTYVGRMDTLEAAINYNLPKTKAAACGEMAKRIQNKNMTPQEMEFLVSSMQTDRDCREALWDSIHQFLPEECQGMKDVGDFPDAVSVPLHELMYLHMKAGKPDPAPAPAPKKKSFLDSSDSGEESDPPPQRRAPAPAPARRNMDLEDGTTDGSDSS